MRKTLLLSVLLALSLAACKSDGYTQAQLDAIQVKAQAEHQAALNQKAEYQVELATLQAKVNKTTNDLLRIEELVGLIAAIE